MIKDFDNPPRIEPKESREAPERPKFLDEKVPVEERKADFEERLAKRDNPTPQKDFDPMTHDPLKDLPGREFVPLERVALPKRLPTHGILPEKVRDSQMVGMYMSKQQLYLLVAHLSNRVADLEEQIALIRQQKAK